MGSRYVNCYALVEDVRRGLNEYSTAFVQGTDTTGAYLNAEIVRHINRCQRYLYNLCVTRKPGAFMKSADIVGVDSAYALPADFFRMIRFEDPNDYKLREISIHERRKAAQSGNKLLYYRKANQLIVDYPSLTDTYTLWYVWKPRLLDFGQIASGGTLAGTLATSAIPEADYYNGMILDNITTGASLNITDYSAARVCTLTGGNTTTSDWYGLVPEIDEIFHDLIAPLAAYSLKFHPKSIIPPNANELPVIVREPLIEAIRSWSGSVEDGLYVDRYIDFEPFF